MALFSGLSFKVFAFAQWMALKDSVSLQHKGQISLLPITKDLRPLNSGFLSQNGTQKYVQESTWAPMCHSGGT